MKQGVVTRINLHTFEDDRGYLVPSEPDPNAVPMGDHKEYYEVPFEVKRVYWIKGIEGKRRGEHAHKKAHQAFFALNGKIRLCWNTNLSSEEFIYGDSWGKYYDGLYVPPMVWHSLDFYGQDSVVLVLADRPYDENDYYRDVDEFIKAVSDEEE